MSNSCMFENKHFSLFSRPLKSSLGMTSLLKLKGEIGRQEEGKRGQQQNERLLQSHSRVPL